MLSSMRCYVNQLCERVSEMCCGKYLLVLFICVAKTNALYEGDSCTTDNGRSGVCKNVNACPAAIDDINRRINPTICTFGVNDPIVCCVESPTTSATEITPTTEYEPEYYDYEEYDTKEGEETCPPIAPELTSPRTGQKSWDKCVEYQELYVYPCKKSMALTGGMSRVSNCKHSANEYIVNGENAKTGEFPHMALLGYGPDEDDQITFSCGGSIISESYILTAGHCTHGGRLGPVTYALLGTLRRSDNYAPDNLYKMKRILKHPSYASPIKYNDIALLETDRLIKMSAYVVPACLDVGNQAVEKAVATGWGATAYAGSNADILQKVNLTKFDTSDCRTWHKPARHMNDGFDERTQICYGDKTQAKDTCGGDSGGPLQIKSQLLKCMYVVVGVTSFGRQCGNVGQPGVYTKVAEYVPWIESVVWP